jgi:hypothetical protein
MAYANSALRAYRVSRIYKRGSGGRFEWEQVGVQDAELSKRLEELTGT